MMILIISEDTKAPLAQEIKERVAKPTTCTVIAPCEPIHDYRKEYDVIIELTDRRKK